MAVDLLLVVVVDTPQRLIQALRQAVAEFVLDPVDEQFVMLPSRPPAADKDGTA